MHVHPAFREMLLRDNQRELNRRLCSSPLQPARQLNGAPRTEPMILRLSWERADDGSGSSVRAAWVR
jgi:hypothetical protein